MAGKQIGRLSIRVSPDLGTFREEVRAELEKIRDQLTIKMRADFSTIRKQISAFRAHQEKNPLEVRIDADTVKAEERLSVLTRARKVAVVATTNGAIARTQLATLTRARVANIHVRVSKASIAKAVAVISALSGVRLANDLLDKLNRHLSRLDLNIPKISRVALAFAGLTAVLLQTSAGLVTVGADLLAIGQTGLALPAAIGSLATGIVALVVALRSAKTELAELGPLMGQLSSSIQTSFWERAKQPIIEMTQSLFPAFRDGMSATASSIGNQAGVIAAAMERHLGGGAMTTMFDNLVQAIDNATGGASALVQAFVALGVAGSAYMPRFTAWMAELTQKFNQWVLAITADGRFDAYMENGIQQAKNLGNSIVGLVGIFSAINTAAEAAGGTGLAAMAANLQGAASVLQGATAQSTLINLFEGARAALDGIAPGMNAIGTMLYSLSPVIEQVLGTAGSAIGTLLSGLAGALSNPQFAAGLLAMFDGIAKGIEGLVPGLEPLAVLFGMLGQTVGVLAAAFGPLLATLKIVFAPVLETILALVTPLVPILAGALTQAILALQPVMAQLSGVFSSLSGPLTGIAETLGQVFVVAIQVVAQVLSALLPIIMAILPGLLQFGEVILSYVVSALNVLMPIIADLLAQLGPVLQEVIAALMPVLLALAPIIGETLVTVVSALAPIIGELAGLIVLVLQAVLPLLPELMGLVSALAPILPVVAELAGHLLKQLVTMLGAVLPPIISLAGTIISALLPVIQAVLNILGGLITFLTGVFTGNWKMAWKGIQQVIQGLIDGVVGILSGLWDIIAAIPGTIGGLLAGAGTWLFESGKSVIQGLIDGIMSMANAIGDAVGGLLEGVREWFPFSPAKKGPFSGKGWVLHSGRSIGRDFAKGIGENVSDVEAAAARIAQAATFDTQMDVSEAATGLGAAYEARLEAVNGDQIVVQGDVGYDPAAITAEMAEKKRQTQIKRSIRKVSIK